MLPPKKAVAIIPARGGSKRIPRKNIRLFAGQPIINYSIQAALNSGLFDRIIVSTDDEEIAAIAVASGAEVPFIRPHALANDYAGTNEVVRHALQTLQKSGDMIEFACCIYATAPFVTPENLRKGWETLASTGKNYAFSVTSFPFPIFRAIRLNEDGGVQPCFPEYIDSRSQDLPETYHDAGQFYWGKSEAFLSDLPLFSSHAAPVVLPRHLVQDIDSPEDWARAELMFEAWQKKTHALSDPS